MGHIRKNEASRSHEASQWNEASRSHKHIMSHEVMEISHVLMLISHVLAMLMRFHYKLEQCVSQAYVFRSFGPPTSDFGPIWTPICGKRCTKKTTNCCKLSVKSVANNPQWSCKQAFCNVSPGDARYTCYRYPIYSFALSWRALLSGAYFWGMLIFGCMLIFG